MSRRGAPKLPRLSDEQVLTLLTSEVYTVCPDTAEVARDGKPIKPVSLKRQPGRYFVRLYGLGGVRTIMRNKLAWMAGAKALVPAGFEIHHDDENHSNDAWHNLICLHALDHRKQHARCQQPEEVPF